MRFVDQPVLEPHRCAVTHKGASQNTGRWIDTGSTLPGFDPHVYLSESAVLKLAELVDCVPGEVHQASLERITELEREKEDLALQLAEADRQLTAIDTIESAGFRARKKTGRPPKEKVN